LSDCGLTARGKRVQDDGAKGVQVDVPPITSETDRSLGKGRIDPLCGRGGHRGGCGFAQTTGPAGGTESRGIG
jgi:hypothetical protein